MKRKSLITFLFFVHVSSFLIKKNELYGPNIQIQYDKTIILFMFWNIRKKSEIQISKYRFVRFGKKIKQL